MHFLRKLIFKGMEFGLGLKTYFCLKTLNPIFINFKLTPEERELLQKKLPPGVKLQPIQFWASDTQAEYYLSYNLYAIEYPKKELQHIQKVRCEINTFVTDPHGRQGIYVFCGSPFVSKEMKLSFIQWIVDIAERVVMWIYRVGELIPFQYELTKNHITIDLQTREHELVINSNLSSLSQEALSEDYQRFNDYSFFNGAKTFDRVNTTSDFTLARFYQLDPKTLQDVRVRNPFFNRAPDSLHFYHGSIPYLVDALNPNT